MESIVKVIVQAIKYVWILLRVLIGLVPDKAMMWKEEICMFTLLQVSVR